MFYIILAGISICAAFFCLLSVLFKVPTFKGSKSFHRTDQKKGNTFSAIINELADLTVKIIPMGVLKKAEMQRLLTAADIKETPEKYRAKTIVYAASALLFALPFYFIHKILVLIPAVIAVYIFSKRKTELTDAKNKRVLEIEKELPRFVAYMNNIMRANRNIIDNFNNYRKDYDTPLTRELAITVADMRTGNLENALIHLENRVNSTYLSSVTRGLISAIRGNDITAYFDNLNLKLQNVWEERLKAQALEKEPKISRMSMLLFITAIITVVVVLTATVTGLGYRILYMEG